jgi:hypothetical protein
MRNAKNIFLIIVGLIAGLLIAEIVSRLILKHNESLHFQSPYFNREFNPYYVFKNTPGYEIKTNKRTLHEKDIVIDEYGFVSNKTIPPFKNDSTIRIFITGGSAAFGNGQSQPYDRIKKYQGGVYSYESSISGQLEKILSCSFPDFNFEVINAAASGRMLHHSIGLYLSLIKDLCPSIVISIDGMNDLATINGISPYSEEPIDVFKKYLDLYQFEKNFNRKSNFAIINLIKAKRFKTFVEANSVHNKQKLDKLLEYSIDDYSLDEYLSYKPEMVKNSNTFLDLIKYYNSLCKLDNVKFIFCVQPLLNRRINKDLSDAETEMQLSINPINISLTASEINDNIINAFEKNGNYTLMYFFDDYLSSAIDSLSLLYDFKYIDFNKEISGKYSDIEFYTDYCHLTFEANRIVASILAVRVTEILFASKNITHDKID